MLPHRTIATTITTAAPTSSTPELRMLSRPGTGASRVTTAPGARLPPPANLLCNMCRKPLATTCYLTACDCIFCEGTKQNHYWLCVSMHVITTCSISFIDLWHLHFFVSFGFHPHPLYFFFISLACPFRMYLCTLWKIIAMSPVQSITHRKWFHRTRRGRRYSYKHHHLRYHKDITPSSLFQK